MWFDSLVDLLKNTWGQFVPWIILNQFDAGVVLRLGKYNRRMNVGFNWKLPFIETIFTHPVVMTTHALRSQSLSTKDGVELVVTGVLNYEIFDVKPFLLKMWDRKDVLSDIPLGEIAKVVRSKTYDELLQFGVEKFATNPTRRRLRKYGVSVNQLTFPDFTKTKSLRIISDADINYIEDPDE